MRRFCVVATGRGNLHLARASLQSIADQQGVHVDVCAVDDASPDPAQVDYIKSFCADHGWTAICNTARRYPLANQYAAWCALDPSDADVVAWVDLDDRLAYSGALAKVSRYYDQGVLLTYGSYEPVPADHPSARTCKPARPYPPHVARGNRFRRWGHLFNHLRTVSWRILKHITPADLQDAHGNWFTADADAAVMIPALEIAGHRYAFIRDTLYLYTCDSPDAVWRTQLATLGREHALTHSRPRRSPLP